jgi:hypothetical protein
MVVITSISRPRRSATAACPVLGCTRRRTSGQIMCIDCFNRVPTPIRARYWSLRGDPSTRHGDAIQQVTQEAIASVPPEKAAPRRSTKQLDA